MADGGPEAELVEVVDEQGIVIDVVTRATMREHRLRHRCTYVAVITSGDELVVHQRADWKEIYPGWWDVCFGGVSDVGEPWEQAARRELAEEAGLVAVDLSPIGSVHYDEPDGSIIGEAYVVYSDEEPSCPDGEVVAIDRVPISELDLWLSGRDVCRDSVQCVLPLLRAHFAAQDLKNR